MLGNILTGLYDLVEETFGLEVLDELITASNLSTEGIYSGIGSYPHSDMISLVQNLSRIVDMPSETLMHVYGAYLFKSLMASHVHYVGMMTSSFDIFTHLDGMIHVEVAKLYPEAEVPKFSCEVLSPDTVKLCYQSERPFASVAEGLIEGCGTYFGEELTITRDPEKENSPNNVTFIIKNMGLSKALTDKNG
ncbi:MAG: hypothetical protein ACI9MS_000265 [Glaciecola sp.]|jgi:hypothetical protein